MKKSTKFAKAFFVALLTVMIVIGVVVSDTHATETPLPSYYQSTPFDFDIPVKRPPK